MAPEELLAVKDVWAARGGPPVLKGVSLHVSAGEVVTILGANGAGKTTLLRTISRLTNVDSGIISMTGRRIDDAPPPSVVKRGIAHVPEGRELFADMSVLENLEMGIWAEKGGDIEARLEAIYAYFPVLRDKLRHNAGALSGGQQQMLAIARGVVSQPKLLLLDEPSLGLAPLLVREVRQVIESLKRDGTAILLVEQNAALALAVADRGHVMRQGQIVLEGTSEELASNPGVKEAYLGA